MVLSRPGGCLRTWFAINQARECRSGGSSCSARRRTIIMLFKTFVGPTLVLFLLAARSGAPGDRDTVQGTWLPSAAELGGKMLPDEVRMTIKLVIKDDKYTVTV